MREITRVRVVKIKHEIIGESRIFFLESYHDKKNHYNRSEVFLTYLLLHNNHTSKYCHFGFNLRISKIKRDLRVKCYDITARIS